MVRREAAVVGGSLDVSKDAKPSDDEVAVALAWVAQLVTDNSRVLFIKGTAAAPRCGFSRRIVPLVKAAAARDDAT
jgi:hypothetical protein